MGGFELALLGAGEPTVRYHPSFVWTLTYHRYPVEGHYQAGSLTGAVASQRVTEARNGALRWDGNPPLSAKAQGRLTARHTGRAERKLGLSDPTAPRGRAVAYRIKATLGITG